MPSRVWVTILVALPVGLIFGVWGERFLGRERRALQLPTSTATQSRLRCLVTTVVYAVLCGGLALATSAAWQSTPEVQPTPWGATLRLLYHQFLIGLILVATVVDWDSYLIPDEITLSGILFGVAGALIVGELQLIHLWVDWSVAIPQVRGPYFPDWFDKHRHLHGLAWSSAGAVVGGALIWGVRSLSSWLLGRETLGFGDVTFMAMLGSFLGWQPIVCVFLLAPLFGLLVGIPLKLLTNKPYLPYGPFLGAGALAVLFAWGPIWFRTRGIFGDWYGLLIFAGMAGIGLVLLLTLLIAYRSIPGK